MSAEDIAQAKADALRSAAAGFRHPSQPAFTGPEVAEVLEEAANALLREAAAELVDVADDPVYTVQTVTDLLSLVAAEVPGEEPVTEAEVLGWEEHEANAVVEWATAVHLRASDNDVEIPALPQVLAARAAAVVVQPCPECRSGKHGNCTGSWDFVKDEAAPCQCAEAGHQCDGTCHDQPDGGEHCPRCSGFWEQMCDGCRSYSGEDAEPVEDEAGVQ